ncbi:MAG: hypothetical protein FWF36_02220 [Propionibacteriaceae bacterium]|nr:hypothetical protein [Propionibacteriaceae bacterium]
MSRLPQTRVLLRTGVTVAIGLALVGIVPPAHADDLNTTKTDTQSQIQSNTNQTDQDQAALNLASAALQQTQEKLVQAQADLIAKQQATQDAQAEDTRLADLATQAQQTLTARQADLSAAQQAVSAGQAEVQSERDTIGLVAQQAAQQNTTLISISMLLTNFDLGNLSDQIQWTDQSFTASQNAMDGLLQAQTQLQQAEDRSQQAETDAATAQQAAQQAAQTASDHLVVTQQAEATAQQAQQTVAAQVTANQKAQTNAQATVNADKAKQTQLQQQLTQIEQQIAEASAADSHMSTMAAASAPSSVSVAAAQAIAKSLMPNYGFGSDQWTCLVNLWNYESGWRVNARNPSSGAYGIPQALPATKMASAGADWLTNPTTQINWGLGYIKGRYGNPCGAWSHEMAHNWY